MWSSPEPVDGLLVLVLQTKVNFFYAQENDGLVRSRIHNCLIKKLVVATWNVRTLVESSGDGRICRKRPQEALVNPHLVDCKLDLLMRELGHYGSYQLLASRKQNDFVKIYGQQKGTLVCTQSAPTRQQQ